MEPDPNPTPPERTGFRDRLKAKWGALLARRRTPSGGQQHPAVAVAAAERIPEPPPPAHAVPDDEYVPGLPPGPLTREQMEMLDAAEANGRVDPGRWHLPPTDERLTPAFWQDPEPDFHGMLSADRIRAYHYAVGRMIRPFQEENLKPAAYELTLGPRWLLEGETRYLSEEQPLLEIPPNSIVFVAMREMLLVPHWLVARFDLSIKFIYEGLLLGTGPQVDPGFKGVLSCPLHNISSEPITLQYKEPFAKIDFVKTSFGQIPLEAIGSQEELYAKVLSRELLGFRDEALKLWKTNKNYRAPIYFSERPQTVRSSVRELEETVGGFRTEVRRDVDTAGARVTAVEKSIRRSQIGTILAAIALGVGMLSAMYGLGAILTNYTDGRVDDSRARPDIRRLQNQVDRLGSQLSEAQQEQRRLQQRLRDLDKAIPPGG